MTVSDVVDKYGYLMDERQLSSLQRIKTFGTSRNTFLFMYLSVSTGLCTISDSILYLALLKNENELYFTKLLTE